MATQANEERTATRDEVREHVRKILKRFIAGSAERGRIKRREAAKTGPHRRSR
jgi:hypothetical protein